MVNTGVVKMEKGKVRKMYYLVFGVLIWIELIWNFKHFIFCNFVKNGLFMEQIVITVEGKSNADLLMRVLNKFNFVKSVIRDTSVSSTPPGQAKDVKESWDEYSWTNPARPATDEELEQLAIEMEKDKGEYSPEEVISFVNEELRKWRKGEK